MPQPTERDGMLGYRRYFWQVLMYVCTVCGHNSGAAYGVSAFVKGQGVPILKQLDIVTRLKDSVSNGSINNRQVIFH